MGKEGRGRDCLLDSGFLVGDENVSELLKGNGCTLWMYWINMVNSVVWIWQNLKAIN
jgi:hypothetical protein